MNSIDNKELHNYGIDLLRVISMLMIIAHHISIHGEVSLDIINANYILLKAVLPLGGKTAVNIFILITGYYVSKQPTVKMHKIMNLIFKMTLFSLILTGMAAVFGIVPISKKLFIKALFPVLFGNNYWFVITYIELILIAPLLNIVINGITNRQFKRYLMGAIIAFCIFPTVFGQMIEINDLGNSNLVWFVIMYFIGAYAREYVKEIKNKSVLYAGGTLTLITFHVLASIFCLLVNEAGMGYSMLKVFADYQLNSIMSLLIAVGLFMLFMGIDFPKNNMLLIVGKCTLGVYLFHDNVNFRSFLWSSIIDLNKQYHSNIFPVYVLLDIIGVFAIGMMLDLFVTFIIEKIFCEKFYIWCASKFKDGEYS